MSGGDAGGVSGGDAGGVSGGSTAGGATSGGSTAGGSTAGGSTAGGSTGGGSTAGGSTSGGSTAGGPAVALQVVTPPRSMPVATCSSVITIEPVNGGGQPVMFSGTVSLAASAGVTFYADSACTTQQSAFVINTSNPRANVYAVAAAPGSFMVTATSVPMLTPAVQGLTVVDGPDLLVFLNAAPSPLKAGACFPMTIQGRRGVTPIAPSPPVPVTLSSVIGAARFYSDPTCDSEITSTTLAGTTTTVFVRALSSPMNRLRAARPLWMPALADAAASPMVRRTTCVFSRRPTLSDGGLGTIDNFTSCSIGTPAAVPLNTAIFMQAISSSSEYADGFARCRLASGNTQVNCSRTAGLENATVNVQVIEDPSRLRVATYDGTCLSPPVFPLSSTVDPASTFLVRAKTLNSNNFDDEDTAVFTLADAGLVVGTEANCGALFLQAVEWRGVRVVRGALDGGMDAGTTFARASMLPPATTNRALLVQSSTDIDAANVRTCSLLVRGSMPSPTEVDLRRAMNTSTCATTTAHFVNFERIDFDDRAVVQEQTATLPQGMTTTAVTLSPALDPTRSIVFASGQQDFGQAGGETSETSPSDPHVAGFLLELNTAGTQVNVRRGKAGAASSVTFYVVQAE
jgi:hypothetical protein